ncbi:FliA/WhiG family RNA polymerase sigma factor [Koleobacter methoxysyntrophicus]|jgi:RNA polymerase sigma factor for flagellar operon FliA|nr:FliA/WhiG family RNA polymerase sigma factor [Koleobacter methoxysyntrophicus]
MLSETIKDIWIEYKKTGDKALREKLILKYAPLVKVIAGRIAVNSSKTEFEDILSYGIFGLIDAIDKFCIDRGVKFETYAYSRIKGAIIDGIRQNNWVPRTIMDKINMIQKEINNLQKKLRRGPTDEEICQALNISMDEYNRIIQEVSKKNILSLDEIIDKGDIRAEISSNNTFCHPEYVAERSELKLNLAKAINELPDKEKLVIALYYYEGLTIKEISEVLGVSESRVSQLHTKAILRLRGRLSRKKHLFVEG